jgi:hypothetical protein
MDLKPSSRRSGVDALAQAHQSDPERLEFLHEENEMFDEDSCHLRWRVT